MFLRTLPPPTAEAAFTRPVARAAATGGPWLAGDSTPLGSRTCARSLPFRSPGTFLIHLRDAGEECPRPFAPQAASWNPPHRLGSTGLGAAAEAAERDPRLLGAHVLFGGDTPGFLGDNNGSVPQFS